MGSVEKLPDGWICKESRSRPNTFYFFNTVTGKSQWYSPVSSGRTSEKSKEIKNAHNVTPTKGKTTTKTDERNKSHSTENRTQLKINDKSKELKKRKSKTPAQDRLQKLVVKNAAAVIDSVKEVVKSANLSKTRKSTNNESIVKKSLFVPKRSGDKKPTSNGTHKKVPTAAAVAVDDDIPVLFPPKNLAQKRLRSLQNSLCGGGGDESGSDHDATRVFGDSFGIESGKPATCDGNVDEEMDWEPCEDSAYTFQQLESMAVDVLTESAYIIPDTNVFLDSLASIKSVIGRECKYKMLIPFVVLQELDQLKHRNSDKDSVSSRASRAIRYIYDELKSKNPQLQGQKAMEDKSHVIDVTSPDDKILNCCLQLQNQSMDIILVTNDKNLSNKALLNGIEAITSRECLERF